MIDHTVIEEAQNGGQSHSSFQREYCAQFTDGSDSYFSAKKMYECTIPDGQSPTSLIKGKADNKYILAIDKPIICFKLFHVFSGKTFLTF